MLVVLLFVQVILFANSYDYDSIYPFYLAAAKYFKGEVSDLSNWLCNHLSQQFATAVFVFSASPISFVLPLWVRRYGDDLLWEGSFLSGEDLERFCSAIWSSILIQMLLSDAVTFCVGGY